jgi:hypothetical protein
VRAGCGFPACLLQHLLADWPPPAEQRFFVVLIRHFYPADAKLQICGVSGPRYSNLISEGRIENAVATTTCALHAHSFIPHVRGFRSVAAVYITLDRMFDVHLFQATAKASTATPGMPRPGDRHAMLVFIRQDRDTEHDWAAAEAGVCKAGWTEVSITRAGTLSSEAMNGKGADFVGAFEYAMNGGCGLIVYADRVLEEEE